MKRELVILGVLALLGSACDPVVLDGLGAGEGGESGSAQSSSSTVASSMAARSMAARSTAAGASVAYHFDSLHLSPSPPPSLTPPGMSVNVPGPGFAVYANLPVAKGGATCDSVNTQLGSGELCEGAFNMLLPLALLSRGAVSVPDSVDGAYVFVPEADAVYCPGTWRTLSATVEFLSYDDTTLRFEISGAENPALNGVYDALICG